MLPYRFDVQKVRGERGEEALDKFFQRWFDIRPVEDLRLQRAGIDRVFVGRKNGQTVTVEYKTDWTADGTGNAFVELMVGKGRGWSLSCSADLLVYFVPGRNLGYILDPKKVREALPKWKGGYRTKSVKNCGFVAMGLLVPLEAFATVAERVVTVE